MLLRDPGAASVPVSVLLKTDIQNVYLLAILFLFVDVKSYVYINSDDGWLDLNRTAAGELNPSAHFANNTLGGENYTLKMLVSRKQG